MSIKLSNIYHTYSKGTPFERLALNDVSASWFLTARRDVSDFFAKPLVKILSVVVLLLIVALVVYVTMFSRRRRYGHRRRSRAGSACRLTSCTFGV